MLSGLCCGWIKRKQKLKAKEEKSEKKKPVKVHVCGCSKTELTLSLKYLNTFLFKPLLPVCPISSKLLHLLDLTDMCTCLSSKELCQLNSWNSSHLWSTHQRLNASWPENCQIQRYWTIIYLCFAKIRWDFQMLLPCSQIPHLCWVGAPSRTSQWQEESFLATSQAPLFACWMCDRNHGYDLGDALESQYTTSGVRFRLECVNCTETKRLNLPRAIVRAGADD